MADTPRRILVAEDEKPLAKAMQIKLTHAGFDVVTVSNGDEVLVEVEKGKFDLILMDLIMPKRDGFATLEALKEKGSKIPVIVTSNLSQQEDVDRVKKLGAVDYLVKSDTPIVAIVERVQKILKG